MKSKYTRRVTAILPAQFIRYVFVGVCLNAISYAAYLLLTWRLLSSEAAMTITFSVGTLSSFLANRRVTFRHQGNQSKALIRFLMSYALLYVFNFTVLWFFAGRLHIQHQIVQAAAILVMTVMAFLMQKFWVFPAAGDETAPDPYRIS